MRYKIKYEDSEVTIKDFLKSNSISSNLVRRLKKLPDGIMVNGFHQNVTYVLKENDLLEINIDDFDNDINEYLTPTDIPIEIIYEDDNITVVNKPSNMPTHESLNNHGNTLANALKYRYNDKAYVFRATNRLDKDTSGVVITANNRYYASLISKKIQNGEVDKEYIALVKGKLTGEGVINAPIDRISESIIKREVISTGEEAISKYKVLSYSENLSLVLLTPVTGRTHQLRVHMAHIGHPIIGDELYGGKSELINRQALHCLKMSINGVREFYAPLALDIKDLVVKYFNEDTIPKK